MLIGLSVGSWVCCVALAGLLLTPLAAAPPLALADPESSDIQVRSVACKAGALVAGYAQNPTAKVADSIDESVPDEQQPFIHGTWTLPGVNEDDSNAVAAGIAAKYDGASPMAPADATAAAQALLVDAGQRKFKKPKLELENTVAVWAIETSRSGGNNPSLEVKLDAANGTPLSVDCD